METIKSNPKTIKPLGLERQEAYLKLLEKSGKNNGSLFITDKVMESMRDSGYRDIRKAINDLIDNSEQAGAKSIAVVTTTAKEEQKNAREKISDIAIIDDGYGMLPKMLLEAVKWGGTDRFGERDGLGRFGFGLPTAAISVTRTYEVYSKVIGGDWFKIRIDLTEIANKAMTSGGDISFTPDYKKTQLPDFIKAYIKQQWKKNDLDQGTVVLLMKADRIRSFALPQTFQIKMMQSIGLTYRHFMPQINFFVNDKKVMMIDPLFLNPNCMGYDAGNGHIAEGFDEMVIRVKNKLSSKPNIEGDIKLRISFLHPKFQQSKDGKEIANRMNTMIENNGYFVVCRGGRQIDVVRDTNYQSAADNTTIVNYDRNWVIELEFDPILDELFGITTNKQQVEIDSYLWDIFKENSLPSIVTGLRKKFQDLRKVAQLKEETNEETDRESEVIMRDAEKYDRLELPQEKKEKADEKLRDEAEDIAGEKNENIEEVVEKLENDAEKKKFKIEFTDHPGAPFYDVEQWGPQTRIKINTAHRFYTDVYSQQDPRGKTALELLLFVLAKCELVSTGEKELFYGNERFEWSRKLDLRLRILDIKDPIVDQLSLVEEAK